MPWIVVFVAFITIMRTLRKQRLNRIRPLCATCSFVHMQYGVNGRNTIFCTYGGGLRAVLIDVQLNRRHE